jgi:hypothetical protein
MRRVRIKLDFAALLAHLSQQEKRQVGLEEALTWLEDAGFKREGDDRFIVAEKDLGQLDPSEVLEAEPLDDDS